MVALRWFRVANGSRDALQGIREPFSYLQSGYSAFNRGFPLCPARSIRPMTRMRRFPQAVGGRRGLVKPAIPLRSPVERAHQAEPEIVGSPRLVAAFQHPLHDVAYMEGGLRILQHERS